MTVTAYIDTSTPAGMEILRELEKKKEVRIKYSKSEYIINEPCKDFEEVHESALDKLSELYGTDIRSL